MSPFCAAAQASLNSARCSVSTACWAPVSARTNSAASSASTQDSRTVAVFPMSHRLPRPLGGGLCSPSQSRREPSMTFLSIDPASGERLREYPAWDPARLDRALAESAAAAPAWGGKPLPERTRLLNRAAEVLLQRRDEYAELMRQEMGKPYAEGQAEVEKCATACRYYAEHAAAMLADEVIETDAKKSLVAYQPLGLLLAIMPWNFPFWQVVRAAAPALAAGNAVVLKHADNVTGCALALEELFRAAGFPAGVFQTLLIPIPMVDAVIRDLRVQAVTLTGSERAGVAVGRAAGESLKKCVLELGGSDAFVVLEDADLGLAAETGVRARYQNTGQSCIAAKRFILVEQVAEAF